MTCPIPQEIEQLLTARAAARHITVEQIVIEALTWYLNVGEETVDELAAWQEIRDEANELIEGQTS
jgi:hypothetical protein